MSPRGDSRYVQMGARFKIRKASRSDSRGFLDLLVGLADFERLPPPGPSAQRRILADIFERKRVNLLLALQGSRPVGYALYFYTYSSFLARPTLYLEDIFVLEEFRGSGIGKSLFSRCVKEATKRDCGRMEWSVLNWNRRAIRFYREMGAKRLSEWSVYRLDSKSLGRLSQVR